MRYALVVTLLGMVVCSCFAADAVQGTGTQPGQEQTAAAAKPAGEWLGKYPVTFISKARSAKPETTGQLTVTVKNTYYDADEKRNTTQGYDELDGRNRKLTTALGLRYGFMANHHVEVNLPYVSNNYHVGSTNLDTNGLGNVSITEEWGFMKETEAVPGMAATASYSYPSGDTGRKVGTDDYSWRVGLALSKAWEPASLHVDVAQTFTEGRDADKFEGNAAVLSNASKTFQPCVEYSYTFEESKGVSHDVVPGFIWKLPRKASLKAGAIFNVDTNMKFRDEVGVVSSLSMSF